MKNKWRKILSWQLPDKVIMKITFHASYDEVSNYYGEDSVEFMQMSENDVEYSFPSISGKYHIVGAGVFDKADSIHASIYVSVPYDESELFREIWQHKDVDTFSSMQDARADYKARRWDKFTISDPSLIKDYNE